MAYELSRSERYHKRAEELRVIADAMSDPTAKEMMLAAAASFDLLADSQQDVGPLSPLFRDP